jgi:hypothetical protein
MRAARNILIVMVLALAVAFLPSGGNIAEAVFTALTMGFLAAIAWAVYAFSRRSELTLAALSDGRRGILYGALGLIALLIAGTDELFATGGGTLLWLLLLGGAVAAIWRIWTEANTY